ncbi:MAG TPA: hypothetical protein VIH86_06505 [Puia sp.]
MEVKELGAAELDKYDGLRITEKTELLPMKPLIRLGDETVINSGDILIISAPPKSAKTAVMSFLISGTVTQTADCIGCIPDLSIVPAEISHNGKVISKAVLHIDTEQNKHWHQKNINQILARVNMRNCPAFFCSYNFRQLEFEDFLAATETVCKKAVRDFDGIHIIFIDGIADYLTSVNDEKESQKIYRWLFKLADTYNCGIVTTLHQNPGSVKKERGHAGSDGQRKADAVIGLVKQDGVITFDLRFMRGSEDIPLVQVKYDKQLGRHVYHGNGRKLTEESIEEIKLTKEKAKAKSHADAVFKHGAALYAADIKRYIQQGFDLSQEAARKVFILMQKHDLIIADEHGRWIQKSPF